MNSICLNHSDSIVQQWFQNVGEEETYRQYVLNNEILPEWNDVYQTVSLQDAKDYLSNFIPADNFKFENIRTIINSLPVGSQAAFWRNTFYFKDAITKGELGEEAFHAIISEIFTDSQREEFYFYGRSLISNLDERVSNALKSAPQSYYPLTNKDREERVIEEFIAEQFRNYFVNNSPLTFNEKVLKFFTNLFETIKEFFGFAETNRNYIDALFNDIVNGKYRNSNVIFSENVTPSTYLIVGKNNSGLDQTLSETESEQVLRNLVGNFFKIKSTNSDLTDNELIDETINIATEVYSELDPVIARAFTQKTFTFNPNLGIVEEIDSPEYLELIDELKKRIKRTAPYMFDAIEEDQGDDVSDENFDNESEYANVGDLTSGADEAGFSKISGWVKEYIGSVGVPVKTISLKNGSEFEWTEAVDGNKIYYGLARALNNTKNDFERLVTLINYSTIDGNYAANAFLNKLLKDIGGTQETVNNILNDYNGIYAITKDANVINRYIKGNSHVLQNILKAFDLWSRTSLFQSVSPESGFTSTTDANINSAVRGQINKWQQNSLSLIESVAQVENIVESIGTQGDYYSKLNTAINTNTTILKDSLGIEISNDTMKWMLFNNTSGVEKVLTAKDKAFYNGFKDNIKTYGSDLEIKALLNKIKTLAKDGVEKIYDGKDSRLELLAKINGVFDESVYEGSYKSADGKTKYAFQHKTFHLEFVRNLQDDNFITSMMNKGLVKYRVNSKGEDVYLVESQDFIHNNLFMSKMFTKTDDGFVLNNNSVIKKILPHFKLESADGIRQVEDFTIPYKKTQLQEKINKSINNKELLDKLTKEYAELESLEGREGDGQTFTNMLTSEFDVYRMNLAVNKTELIEGELLYPHYIGNLEAKRTADFIYLPQIKSVINSDGTMNSNAVKLLKEEIRKEYDRIRRVHQELKTAIENSSLVEGDFTLDSTLARELFNKDVFEKYHTGDVKRKELDGQYVYSGIRALQFTDSVSGILPKSFMKGGLTDAALLNKPLDEIWNENLLKSHWENVIFQEHFDKINPLSDLLDRRWKTNGALNKNKVKEFILSSFINTLAFNQLVHGDPALVYKNDGADMYKRFGGRNAAIESSETFITNPSLGIEKVKQTLRYVVADEIKSLNAFDPSISIDQADAQNYATVEYKRYLLWSRGRLTPFLAKALDDIELGKPLSDAQNKIMKENAEYFNVDKTVAFNGLQYLKKSDFMLTKELTSMLSADALERIKNSPELENDIRRDENNWIARPDMKNKFLHELRQNMEGWRKNSANELKQLESNRYDLYMPISASKMLNINVFNPSTGWDNISDSVMQIDAKNYGLQLENPSGKDRIIDPSQMIEIIFNEQKDNVKVFYKNKLQNITDLGELYQQYLTQRDKSTFDLAYNELLNENDEFDADNFFPRAVESLINSGADPQTIKIFQSTENGAPEFNPNMAITKDKFKDLLFAWFTKSVLQQKVSGDAKAHVSSFGFTPVKRIQEITLQDGSKDYRWDVVRRDSEEYNNLVYNNGVIIPLELEEQNKGEVIYDPTLPSDVLRETLKKLYNEGNIYFTDELRHLVPKYIITDVGTDGAIYAPTTYHTESLMSNTRLDDDINENNRYSFAVRIPSQDKHSAVNIEHVDTFPFYYGNSVATAKEIVALSGSDFDIDKLFIQTPELYRNEIGQYVKYGSGDKRIEYIKYLNDTNKKFRDLSKGISDTDTIKEILGSLRLPTDINEWKNPYELNNELLELKQLALTNDGTLKDEIIKTNRVEKVLIDSLDEALTATPINLRGKLNSWIRNKSDREMWKTYLEDFKILLPYVSETATIAYRTKEEDSYLKEKNPSGYISGENDIVIKKTGDSRFDLQTVLHEMIHLITLKELRENKQFSSKISKLLNYTKEAIEDLEFSTPYGLLNEKEFLAEAFSNPNFAHLLNTIEYNDKSTIWNQFVKALSELLGRLNINVNPGTVLNELMNTLERETKFREVSDRYTTDITVESNTSIKASYKTSVDLDPLKNLDKIEGNIFSKNGKSIFETTNELPAHMFNTHSLVHEKNTVGKQNINPFVNGNLGLILALRAGYKITPEFQFTINGHTANGFKELSADNQRVFDTLSSWISAATDEAKEQLNAKYHINLEGAVILKTLLSLGFQLDTSVAFVNQPVVQEYLKLKEQNNSNIFLGKKQYKSEADIIISLTSPNEDVINSYNNQDLSNGLFGNGELIQNRVLQDLQTINKISSQLSKLTRFLKVKKGFSGGLLQLQQLNEAIDELGIYLTKDDKEYFELNNPVDTTNTFKYGKNIPQVIQVIKEIVPKMNHITGKLLFDQNSGVIGLKNKIFNNLKSLNDETVTEVTREIDSYIALKLYTEEVDNQYLTDNLFIKGDHATVADSFIKLKEEVNKVVVKNLNNEPLSDDEKRLLNLAGTSILKRLTVKTNKDKTIDELKLDTFAKLSVDEQDTLITSYGELIKNLSYLSDDMIEFRDLPKQLFAYWVVKDGLQNKFGSIAKLFPVYMFKEHSHSIDKAMSGNSEIFKQIENPDVFYKDVMKKLARNKANIKLFPTFYFGSKDDARIHDKNNTVNLKELNRLSDETKLKLLSQYPFNYTIDKILGIIITSVPLYVKSSVYNQQENKSTPVMLRLRGFKLYDGTVVRENDENFVNQLEDNILEIEKLDYAVMQTENIVGRSAMTLDMNYSKIKTEENVQEEIDNSEKLTKGCDPI